MFCQKKKNTFAFKSGTQTQVSFQHKFQQRLILQIFLDDWFALIELKEYSLL